MWWSHVVTDAFKKLFGLLKEDVFEVSTLQQYVHVSAPSLTYCILSLYNNYTQLVVV